MKLSQKIAELRKSHNWSQEELAYRLGVTRQSVGKWESDAALPELDKVVQMADIFGVTTDYLLKGNTDGIAANEAAADVQPEQTASAMQATAASETTAPCAQNEANEVVDKKSDKKAIAKGVLGLIWAVALAVYLLWSFIGGNWGFTWIVWPIVAIVTAVVTFIFNMCGIDTSDANGKHDRH